MNSWVNPFSSLRSSLGGDFLKHLLVPQCASGINNSTTELTHGTHSLYKKKKKKKVFFFNSMKARLRLSFSELVVRMLLFSWTWGLYSPALNQQ